MSRLPSTFRDVSVRNTACEGFLLSACALTSPSRISSDMQTSCVGTCSDSPSPQHTPLSQAVSSAVSTAGVNKSFI